MEICEKCRKKIGLFRKKINYEYEKGKFGIYCNKCYKESEYKLQEEQRKLQLYAQYIELLEDYEIGTDENKREMRSEIIEMERKVFKDIYGEDYEGDKDDIFWLDRQDKEKIEREEKKKKEEIEREKRKCKKENIRKVSGYCDRYLQNKEAGFKDLIYEIYKTDEIRKYLIEEDFKELQEYYDKKYRIAKLNNPSSSEEYDKLIELKSSCSNIRLFIQDLIKLRKLIERNEIETDYFQIIEEISKLIDKEINEILEKRAISAYNKISKKNTVGIKQIINEYISLGFIINNIVMKKVLNKFGYECSDYELNNIYNECIEDKELKDFEKNLGTKKEKHINSFDNLNSYQFEEYIEELFSLLGYEVMRTKLSGDQGADIILKRGVDKIVVQVKKYKGSVGNRAVQEVVASIKHYGANKAIVVTTSNFTQSAYELAMSNDVELWDGDRLKSIIKEINKSSNCI